MHPLYPAIWKNIQNMALYWYLFIFNNLKQTYFAVGMLFSFFLRHTKC